MGIREEAEDAARQMVAMGEGTERQRIADAIREAECYLDGVSSAFFETYEPRRRKPIAGRCVTILDRRLAQLDRRQS